MDATAWKKAKHPALALLTWPGLSTLMPRLLPALMALAMLAAGGAAVAQSQTAPRVKFVTSEGEFVVEVYPDKAPKTVANFLQYVNDKHYDGTVFHRVISNFMVQGGGFDARYQQDRKSVV
jgi:peptidyl-prolyl cis-trans isomerase A (cyclophilin A)